MAGLKAPCVFKDQVHTADQCCLPSGCHMARDASGDTSPHIIQGNKGETLSMSLLKDEQHFPSSCPVGQGAVCDHTNTGPWQKAWNAGKESCHSRVLGARMGGESYQMGKPQGLCINADHLLISIFPRSFPCFSINMVPPGSWEGPLPAWNTSENEWGHPTLTLNELGFQGLKPIMLCNQKL